MLEIEKKIVLPCSFVEKLVETLERIGFTRIWSGTEEDKYFQHPCRDFRQTDEALRLRKSIDTLGKVSFTLTWKGRKMRSDVKARPEVNFHFNNDPDNLENILRHLGFNLVATITKERDVYELGNTKVFLDKVDKLGCFVEIEVIGEEEEAVFIIQKISKDLGMESFPSTLKSYLELYMEKHTSFRQ